MAGKIYKKYTVAGREIIIDATWAREELRYAIGKLTEAIDALQSAQCTVEHVGNTTGIDQEVTFEIDHALAKLAYAMADAFATEKHFIDMEEGREIEDGGSDKAGPVDNG